jgi:hypothetical protein
MVFSLMRIVPTSASLFGGYMPGIPPLLLHRARDISGNPNLTAWYVEPGKPVVIGYADTSGVAPRIRQLSKTPVGTETRMQRAGKQDAGLYWMEVIQQAGAVLYRWKPPGAKTFTYTLVFADAGDDTKIARQETAAVIRRARLIWRLMLRTGRDFKVVDRVCEGVNNKLGHAIHAFRLADHLLQSCVGTAGARETLRRLNNPHTRDRREVQQIFGEAGIKVRPEVVIIILRGALLAIGRRG